MSDQERKCDCCGHTGTREFHDVPGRWIDSGRRRDAPPPPPRTDCLCDVCYRTTIRNLFMTNGFGATLDMDRMIAQCTNLILDAIERAAGGADSGTEDGLSWADGAGGGDPSKYATLPLPFEVRCPHCGATAVPTGHWETLAEMRMEAFYVTEEYTFMHPRTGQRWLHVCAACEGIIPDEIVEAAGREYTP